VSDHHHQLVQRVVHALDDRQDPDALVWTYFDQDRDAVIQATLQTLEATREYADEAKVARAVDRELIEGLRFPSDPPRGLLPLAYVQRLPITAAAAFLASLLAALLLL
jgi:hypothetical protein